MLTIRMTPEIDENGDAYILVDRGGSTDRVGPLQAGVEVTAVLEDQHYTSGPPSNHVKHLSRRQEQRNADLIGGRTQPGSGSSNRAKGDVRKLGEYRGESKFTFSYAYQLDRRVLEKITGECGDGEKPILFIDYKNKETSRTHGSYVVLHENDFKELLAHAPSHDQRPARGRPRGG